MSYTEIYGFSNHGKAYLYGRVENSWRGGMAIWRILEEKHLPQYRPPYVPAYIPDDQVESWCHFKPSRLIGIDGSAAKEVLELVNNKAIPIHERITLATTLDYCIVKKEHIPKLIEAFNAFEGETSLPEQVKILQAMYEDKKCIAVGWNQTSVNCTTWDTYGRDKKGNCKPYNLKIGDKHWSLFDDEDIKEAEKTV